MRFYFIPFLCIISTLLYSQKLSPKFTTGNGRIDASEELTFSVSCIDTTLFKQTYGNTISVVRRHAGSGVFTITASYALVTNAMATDANIRFIDITGQPVEEAGTDFVNLAFNRIKKVHAVYPDVQGQPVRVSIKEQGFDHDNIDLRNRWFTTSLTPEATSQHAMIMATIIGGGENSSIKGRGVARAAQLTSSDFNNLLPDADAVFMEHDIHLQNHSYGISIENYYGNEATAYDQQVYDHPELVHVFSAGNSGLSAPGTGMYTGLTFANLSGNFKQGKNHLTITAVDTTLSVNPANSRGPAYDGRLKPDLTAFGQDGTSDAAALVSGIAALVQQRYADVHGVLPPAALLKAILIASANDIGAAGIDYTYGYGSVNAYQALQTIDAAQTSMIDIASDEERPVTITVPANTATLQIAVTWTDVPAAPNSAKALVHDIDAVLTNGGNTWLPWVLRTAAHVDSLTAAPRRRADHLNTVEYITVEAPAPGTYTLQIKAPTLTTAGQAVAVAWWTDANTPFVWDYPAAGDILEAGKQDNLFWTHHTSETGTVSLQLNDGTWTTLRSSVNPGQPFHWTPPDTLASARLKMTIGGNDYLSESFTISPVRALSVAYACADEFMLTWHPVAGAEEYEVYTLGDTYLQKIFTTPDTAVALPATAGPYFAVAARTPDATGAKSATINYQNQGAFCYINLFEALRYDGDHVRVQLTLSTWINVDHVTIYKTVDDTQQTFTAFAPGRAVSFAWDDSQLIPDTMRYQAAVVLTNGTVLYSDIVPVLIETPGQARLFPNPVPPGGTLNILSEGPGFSLSVFDDMGRLMLTQTLVERLDTMDVSALRTGMYFYQLRNASGSVVNSGRFVKL